MFVQLAGSRIKENYGLNVMNEKRVRTIEGVSKIEHKKKKHKIFRQSTIALC